LGRGQDGQPTTEPAAALMGYLRPMSSTRAWASP
jgi:hypothetical protein